MRSRSSSAVIYFELRSSKATVTTDFLRENPIHEYIEICPQTMIKLKTLYLLTMKRVCRSRDMPMGGVTLPPPQYCQIFKKDGHIVSHAARTLATAFDLGLIQEDASQAELRMLNHLIYVQKTIIFN